MVLATPLWSQYRPDSYKLNSDERNGVSPFLPGFIWKTRSENEVRGLIQGMSEMLSDKSRAGDTGRE
jgi:hypothetical protein